MKLYEHQQRALQLTNGKNRVAYYLDMGLGKTYVASEKMKALGAKVNLVICQKSKLTDWYEHFSNYYKDYTTLIYSKTQHIPQEKVILIINYDLVWRRPELLKLKDFTLVLDESSYVKNETSKRCKFILKLKSKNVILLSGTPTGGKYEELYSQLKLLGWDISKKLYWDSFIKYVIMNIGGIPIKKVTGYKNTERLKHKLSEYGAVFMKTDEVFDLPEQVEQIVHCDVTSQYKKFIKNRYVLIGEEELLGDMALNRLLYSRQLASQYNPDKLCKLQELMEGTEDRLIIFYSFNAELELIKAICKKLKKPVSVVNGQNRDLSNYEKYSDSVTLIQYQAGAMGLNLQLSNKIIYFSLPLSSELFEQSKKRTHRIGQSRTCFYYYLVTNGWKDRKYHKSVDEMIFETLKMRKDFTDALFEKECR